MFAQFSNIGPGIAFAFAIFSACVVCVIWVAAWVPRGFRYRCQRDPGGIRRLSRIQLAVIAMLLLCFPPLRSAGIWTDTTTNTAPPHHLLNAYDRSWFGYIPTHAWIGRCITTKTTAATAIVSLDPDETFQLHAFRWRIDWVFLIGEFGIAILFLFPFLAARSTPAIAERADALARP